ncbi:hypothetical protein [Acidithiobacillus ferriphilus]|jgi:hypothetical protein|uniref:hypothetical protein n=1 Tax=Acidithiobacillus ferriphilus TaxID=1689834 RepID=UPI00232E5836|nr:hypothetical protein [Acidithiobacillus ferriphilus]WCE94276.1 hypothetical protein PJU76_01655 [Acidithiobacillus ferriphilus]
MNKTFLNLHPDRLEVVNPDPLPLGVTPQNMLHTLMRIEPHRLAGLDCGRCRALPAVEDW